MRISISHAILLALLLFIHLNYSIIDHYIELDFTAGRTDSVTAQYSVCSQPYRIWNQRSVLFK